MNLGEKPLDLVPEGAVGRQVLGRFPHWTLQSVRGRGREGERKGEEGEREKREGRDGEEKGRGGRREEEEGGGRREAVGRREEAGREGRGRGASRGWDGEEKLRQLRENPKANEHTRIQEPGPILHHMEEGSSVGRDEEPA